MKEKYLFIPFSLHVNIFLIWFFYTQSIFLTIFFSHPISRKPINHYELSKNVLDSIDRVVHRINKLHPKEPPMSPPSYFIGRIVNVAIWENSHWDVIFGQQWGKDDEFDDIESNIKSFRKKFKIGNFIRLRNVKDGRTLNDQRSECLCIDSPHSEIFSSSVKLIFILSTISLFM